MRMMKNWIIGVLLLGTVISYGQIYQGSTQLGTSMSLDITFNTNTDSVSM